MQAIYVGQDRPYLQGKTCSIQAIDNDAGTYGVQFDDLYLSEAYGCHWMPQSYFKLDVINDWFSMTRASWLTMPRVMLQEMPQDWQLKFTLLLEEYDAKFFNQPNIGTRVQITDMRGHLIPTPDWLINYRHPNQEELHRCQSKT